MTGAPVSFPDPWDGAIDTCEVSKLPIIGAFVFGDTRFGSWAVMSEATHDLFGCGVGPDLGQRYEQQADGLWWQADE